MNKINQEMILATTKRNRFFINRSEITSSPLTEITDILGMNNINSRTELQKKENPTHQVLPGVIRRYPPQFLFIIYYF